MIHTCLEIAEWCNQQDNKIPMVHVCLAGLAASLSPSARSLVGALLEVPL